MQARLTYGAAATALPQPGTPTVGHTAASLLAVLPLLRLRWRQDLLSPPTSLPPTPPPPSPPPPPPPNHRSTEGETQRLTTTWLPPPPPLPSPPPTGRAQSTPGEKGREGGGGRRGRGGECSPRCRSSQWLPTLLPRSRRPPTAALRLRTLSALARFGCPSGVCVPALTLRARGWS